MSPLESGGQSGWLASWKGEAVNWECDELGHLNMRHYVGKAEEARQFLFIHLGLAHAYRAGAPSTVRTRELTVCYLREARPGARLAIRSGVTRLGEVDADVVHVMEHAPDAHGNVRVAATVEERVEHIALRTQAAFAWPQRLRKAVRIVDAGGIGARGLPGIDAFGPDRDAVIAMGADRVGAGVFRASEADAFGHIRPTSLFGRCSESVGHFRKGFPETHAAGGLSGHGAAARVSGVLLEMRLVRHAPAAPGRAFEVWSGLLEARAATRNLVHHIVDPVSGASFASMVATSGVMDLERRRLVKSTPDALERLRRNVLPGLTA